MKVVRIKRKKKEENMRRLKEKKDAKKKIKTKMTKTFIRIFIYYN